MFAAMSSQFDAARVLLASGADIHATDNQGFTVLMVVNVPKQFDPLTGLPKPVTAGQQIDAAKMSRFLLDNGAGLGGKDSTYGDTALIHMALIGFNEVVSLLLDKGADINEKNNNGETALSCAADIGESNMVKLLLVRGADINALDNDGETPLGKAKAAGNVIIVQLLHKAGATALSASDSYFNPLVASGTNTDNSGYVTNVALLTPFTLTNSAGDVITNAVLVKLTPNKFVYQTTDASATGMLPLASLSEDLREQFGYDPQRAQAADNADQQKIARQQQYIQRQKEFAAQQASLKIQSQSTVSDISVSIRAFAEKEWPDNYDMQKFVINQQTEAYNWIATASSATGVPQAVFDNIKAKAADQWPDNYDMQKFEINQQVKAYNELH